MPSTPSSRSAVLRPIAVALVSVFAAGSLHVSAEPRRQESSTELRRRALDLAYNLDHEEALALLERAVELSPDEPSTHRALASILWLNILFQRGAVTVDHYLGSLSRARVDLQKPPPDLDARFRRHAERARQLAEQRVASNPRNAQAHYDLGAALGLQASYIATVEGRLLAGFKAARRAFDEHEKVLALDPGRTDAGVIVGTYRYLVSTLSLPMRMMAYVAGFGGGRDEGVEYLRMAAAGRSQARTDALFALVLVYNREARYDEALRVLGELRRLYPRNRLVVLEAGATALRAGYGERAEALLTEGIDMAVRDRRAHVPGETALWHYKRGAARALLRRSGEALADLRIAVQPGALPWVSGRARVEIGRIALNRGDAVRAASEARQAEALCETGRDPYCIEQAKELLRSSDGR